MAIDGQLFRFEIGIAEAVEYGLDHLLSAKMHPFGGAKIGGNLEQEVRDFRNRCFQATAVQGMSSAMLLAG